MSNTLPVSTGGSRQLAPAGHGQQRAADGVPVLHRQAEALASRYAERENAALDLVLSRLAQERGSVPDEELESLIDLLNGDSPRQQPKGASYAAPGRPDRARFFTDVRRLWMHSAARQRPNAILLVSVRTPTSPGIEEPLELRRRIARVREAIGAVFARLTEVYAFDRDTIAMVLPGLNLRQAVAIAESTRRAVEQERVAHGPRGIGPNLLVQAGVVALHREDDPSSAICLAVRCLEIAAESPVSKVVCETDPEARFAYKSRFRDPRAEARQA